MLEMWGLQVPANAMKVIEITNCKQNLSLPNMEQSKLKPTRTIIGIKPIPHLTMHNLPNSDYIFTQLIPVRPSNLIQFGLHSDFKFAQYD